MSQLAEIIIQGEEWLVKRVVCHAEQRGYARYTPVIESVWKSSIAGLSDGLLRALESSDEIPELSPGLDFARDTIASFGINEAKKHRDRGVSLEMFLGMMKYFRQSYHDLLDESMHDPLFLRRSHIYIERYFDRIELGFIAEWEQAAEAINAHHEQLLLARNADLEASNSRLQREIAERVRADKVIKQLNTGLEKRVAERTLQLERLAEQNNYKLKELALLNSLSRVNLSHVRLDNYMHLVLSLLISEPPCFFDRAMLFLVNERSESLQGMLGMSRDFPARGSLDRLSDSQWIISDEEMAIQMDTSFSRKIRSCRMELAATSRIHSKKVFRVKSSAGEKHLYREVIELFGMTSFAVIPLMGNGRIFGQVIVDNPLTGREIRSRDLKFLQLFANHAGVAIENLMLYTSLEDANRRLHEAQEQLIHGERLATIGEMAASIAHELKGPMVSIGGFARRLAKKIPAGSTEAGYVSTIIEEELRLEKMLTDVLSFSRKTTICYERFAINAIVDSALAVVIHALNKSNIRVVKSYPGKPIFLYGDPHQLKQVLLNLFYNAHDAMKGGGELLITVSASRVGGGKGVSVKVSDTGDGLSPSAINSIFNPFFTTKKSGTGLGLSISSRIVSNHGGKLRAGNNPEGGAMFVVLLPCRD